MPFRLGIREKSLMSLSVQRGNVALIVASVILSHITATSAQSYSVEVCQECVERVSSDGQAQCLYCRVPDSAHVSSMCSCDISLFQSCSNYTPSAQSYLNAGDCSFDPNQSLYQQRMMIAMSIVLIAVPILIIMLMIWCFCSGALQLVPGEDIELDIRTHSNTTSLGVSTSSVTGTSTMNENDHDQMDNATLNSGGGEGDILSLHASQSAAVPPPLNPQPLAQVDVKGVTPSQTSIFYNNPIVALSNV